MSDVRALAQQGVRDAQTGTAVALHNDASTSIEQTFQKLLPKLAQASLAKMPPEFIVSTAMTVLRNSDQLRECDPLSVVHCVVQSAQTGLRLDPVLQQAALVARYNGKKKRLEAQFMPMYKGLLLLSRRSGKIIHVAAQPVYDCDGFQYAYGSNQELSHVPALKREKNAGITHYYAYIKLANGGFQFEVMTQAEIDEVKAFALKDKKNKEASPWTTDPIPMSLKTVLRRLLKLAPVEDPMLQAAIQADEMLDRGILQEHVVENGLVVPSASYQEAEAEAAVAAVDEAETKLANAQAAETVRKEVVDEQVAWVETCISLLPALAKKKDRTKAQDWGREAKKRLDDGRITQQQFDTIVVEFRKYFPVQPAPQPSLFGNDGAVQPGDGAVVQPKADKAGDSPDTGSNRRGKGKKTVVGVVELSQQIAEAGKLSVLFTIRGRIEKADIPESEKGVLFNQWDAKNNELKGAKN